MLSKEGFNFWNTLRGTIIAIEADPFVVLEPQESGFPIHPSASELAEQMLVDPSVLENETYEPGIYDESGDYYPQYSDDPSTLPEGFEPAPLAGDAVPEPEPGNDLDPAPSPESDGKQPDKS